MTRLPAALALLALAGCGGPPPARPTTTPSGPQPAPATDARLLFVGNSHTGLHGLPDLVAGMVQALRPGRTAAARYVPVGFLEDTAADPTAGDAVDLGAWTAVVLQAQKISVSGRFSYSRAEGLALARRAKSKGAVVVFYPEWGLKGRPGDGARQEAVYREMAAAAGATVAPVATAWDLALAERPDLPLYAADGNHQSELGAFLTACVLAATLTGASPAGLADHSYPAASAADRRFLAGVAARAVAGEKPGAKP